MLLVVKTVGTLITGKCASVYPHNSFFIYTEEVKLSGVRVLVGPCLMVYVSKLRECCFFMDAIRAGQILCGYTPALIV